MNVRERITPDAGEQAQMDEVVAALLTRAKAALAAAGIHCEPTVQGSVAKGTWLAGNTDIDLFLLLDPAAPENQLKKATQAVGHAILNDPQEKYAQHPYLIGTFQGYEVDLVPAYAVAEAGAHMSAVDRTPFHTRWVLAHSDGALRGDIRLAKQWCKGVGVYGADTATGGFSGYLVEVLVIAHGGFEGFLQWLTAPGRVALGDDRVEDDVSPLVVVDPVDVARNCGAALHAEVLARATEAAGTYLQGPDERFFFPAPPRDEPEARAQALASQGATWLGLRMTPQTDRLDLVLPQFHRAARTLHEAFERAGFPVHRHQVDVLDDVCMQFLVDEVELSRTFTRQGPPPDQQPNADRFRQKWAEHPDRAGPIDVVDGRLAVEVQRHARTPAAWLAAEAPRFQGGKHVVAALKKHRVATEPRGSWAPLATDFILDRRPWQR